MGDEDKVLITAKDVYEQVMKLVVGVNQLTQELKESRKTDDDHEKRLRVVERWMWGLPVAFLTAVSGVVIALMKG